MRNLLYLFACLFFVFTKNIDAQQIIKSDKATYTINGAYYFTITKTDNKTNKPLFKAETKIPDKSKKQAFYTFANKADFKLINDNIFIVYDVWMKDGLTKDCYIRLMDVKNGTFSNDKLVYSTKLNTSVSSGELQYIPAYSPNYSKLAILKDNISPGYDIDPEIIIYDTKTLNVISTKKMSGKYNGVKRIFDQNNFSIDDNGNIKLMFHLLNEQTKITTKSYTADIPFNETDLKNISELSGNSSNDNSSDGRLDQKSHGRFYKTLQDYLDDKPIPGVRIKNGSYKWSLVSGTDFKLIDDDGNVKKEDSKDLPSNLFTYKSNDYSSPYIIRIINEKPYIVLAAGKLNYYSLYEQQQDRYFSEGWDGELKKFKENRFEEYLEKYNLLDAYKKDKPKREMKDDVNGYFNKIIDWQINYFNKLNKVM